MWRIFHSLQKCALFLFFVTVIGCQSEHGLAPGNYPPDFTLQGLDGRPHSVAEYRGKVVLLNFWASWCGTCAVEMPELQRLYDLYSGRGLVVLAIGSEDSKENLQQYVAKNKLTFPVLVDENGAVKNQFHVPAFPETFLLGRDGKFRLLLDMGEEGSNSSPDPVIKVVGARSWSAPSWRSQIEELLH